MENLKNKPIHQVKQNHVGKKLEQRKFSEIKWKRKGRLAHFLTSSRVSLIKQGKKNHVYKTKLHQNNEIK